MFFIDFLKKKLKVHIHKISKQIRHIIQKLRVYKAQTKIFFKFLFSKNNKEKTQYFKKMTFVSLYLELNQKLDTKIPILRSIGFFYLFFILIGLSIILAGIRTKPLKDLRQEILGRERAHNVQNLLNYNSLKDAMRKKSSFIYNTLAKQEKDVKVNNV